MRIYYLSPNCWVDKTILTLVAGGRFELPTSGLWIQRSHQLSYPAIPVIPMDWGFEVFWKIHLCLFLCLFYPFLWSHISFSSSRYTLRNFSPGIGLIVSYFWFGKIFQDCNAAAEELFRADSVIEFHWYLSYPSYCFKCNSHQLRRTDIVWKAIIN